MKEAINNLLASADLLVTKSMIAIKKLEASFVYSSDIKDPLFFLKNHNKLCWKFYHNNNCKLKMCCARLESLIAIVTYPKWGSVKGQLEMVQTLRLVI